MQIDYCLMMDNVILSMMMLKLMVVNGVEVVDVLMMNREFDILL